MYYFLCDLHGLLLECLLGLRLLEAKGARSTGLCCRAPRPLVLCSLEKLLAAGRVAAVKRDQNVSWTLDGNAGRASTICRYGFARENPGIPLGAFPENTKKSRKVFLKPVEFCIFTHCIANRYKRLFFNCLWRFLLTPGQPLGATL